MAETKQFKAEIKEVLDLVIHSLYSKKEIFLRELISNASDAIDRAEYLALTDQTIAPENPKWQIQLLADKEAHTLTIVDTGVGMSAKELEDSLGTIAKSGTKAFSEALKNKEGANIPELIGQFGVGFYAAFMVADSVSVESLRRGAGQQAVRWFSTGDGDYTLDAGSRSEPGTAITLHLREGMDQYAEEWTLKDLVKRYSDFIAYPIYLALDGKAVAEDAEPLNTMRAIWKRSKSEIKPEEYVEFYKHLTHDFKDPIKTMHISAEGVLEYKAILFIPGEMGMDLMMPNKKHGLNLYVRNVFIGSDFEALMPEYMRFIKGVVDSSDLPLNVSREMLQDDTVIRKMRTDLTNRVFKTLTEMAKDKADEYKTFYLAFGDLLKEGLHSDWENKDKLKKLIMYPTMTGDDATLVSLQQYKDAMGEKQKAIYALTADSLDAARRSPCLEALKQKGYDVLLMASPIDQWIADGLGDFDGTPIVFVDKADLDLGEDEGEKQAKEEKLKAASESCKPLVEAFAKQLESTIKEVRVSDRLTQSPCCLVEDASAMSPAMMRMMKAMGQDVPEQKRILEVNPDHALIQKLLSTVAVGDTTQATDMIDLLYGQALLAEGAELPDAQRFISLVSSLMAK